ncbi:cold shock domain-containing protein [Streptomyces sp. NPDC005408]|uniref:cold shock domain-containing protein n=1 Tax=Streptomyces sp. NPDC005408 TaxID=3155341 RepID=UPI0033AD0047
MKWFDPGRGMGVIAQEGTGPDAVAYRSAVHGDADSTLVAGERVLFDLTRDAAGVRADNIRPAPRNCCPPTEGPGSDLVARPAAGRLVQ